MPVTILGLPKALRRMDPRYLIDEPLAEYIAESAPLAQREIQSRTPVVSGALFDSIKVQTYASMAKISSTSVYGRYIETGQRTDPRVHSGIVYRRRGPARMFREGGAAARSVLNAQLNMLKARILARWGGGA